MKVEIIPHKGMKEIPGQGFVEIDLGQDFIVLDGVRVGIVGRDPNSGICLNGVTSDAVIHHIRDAVDKHKGVYKPERKIAVPERLGDNEKERDNDE